MTDIILIKLELENEENLIAPPYGILYLASALRKAGYKVKLYHEAASSEKIQSIVDDILQSKPIFVGFSTLTGPNLIPNITVSKLIKKKSDIPIVWGGLHPTMLPRQTMENENIDIVVMGEGEEVIVELAEILKTFGLDPAYLAKTKGISFKDSGKIWINPVAPFVKNLDDYSPAWEYLDVSRYVFTGKYFYSDGGSKLSGRRIATILTSRGCPWRCGYCYNVSVNKRTFRAHSSEFMFNYIKEFKEKHNISALVIEDDNFFADKKRAFEIASNINMPWWAGIRVDQIVKGGDEFVKKLSEYNCVELQIGAESGSQRILDIIDKDISVKDIYKSVELCSKYNIRILFSFMIGIPGETWKDMLETFDLMDNLRKMGSNVVINGPAVYYPWPGTPLHDKAVETGFKPPKKLEEWNFLPFGTHTYKAPFIERDVRLIEHYKRLAWREETSGVRFPLLLKLLTLLSRHRWNKRFFRFPIDYYGPRLVLSLLRFLGLKKAVKAIYDY